jgi:hypothetical protein
MPKILKTHDNLEYIPHDGNGDTNERNWNDDEEPRLHLRAWNGGMPSQRPDRWDRSAMASQSCRAQAARWSWFHGTMAFLVVFSGTLAAWLLSFFVPPDLFLCRQIAQSSAFWFWLPSFAIQYLVAKCVAKWAAGRDKWKKWASWVLLVKDLVCALAVTNVILVTQWGIMNRSS